MFDTYRTNKKLFILLFYIASIAIVNAQEKGRFDGYLSISGAITGFKKDCGIRIALYDSQESFKHKKFTNALRIPKDSLKADTVFYTLNKIKKGEYLIAAYQDLNGDNQISTNLLGIPTEPFQFFKPIGSMERPLFSKCKFELNENIKNADIKLVTVPK